ncbi:DUF982 domain-containing protein [Neorhizobium alkalisoli]|jgi:hypothetical protein|uniref:Uncharacterized protein DUF982 n=1 Tax=Neorhizobium alkalisoli TaxID=528178 RepID=A0A561QCG6_9HYPH|nr:DUF982 domain-containing protein [Neorhizobium alkalisoli]TWF48064.1 uncharacterized protein DUF982 [Neorhizobium alkalisoli]
MSSIITVGFRLEWEHPVIIRHDHYQDRAIQSPREALKYLTTGFTIRSGQPYWSAVSACNAALRHKGDLELSRETFVAAYAEYLVKIYPNR